MVLHLAMGRKIKIDDMRLEYFTQQLLADGYHPDQAQRAQDWIMKGDWKFKGVDPTLELADFYPTPEQYEQTLRKTNDRVDGNRYEPREEVKPEKKYLTQQELDEWALIIITQKEPKWGFKLDVDWINRNRERVRTA
jgi:hypothetical protein